ncbi:hypothetical protein [Mycobacterium asiaticum]|uniref:hypothetical protein n=1 Tax=Mycobacterium asiaticum TaxID=1790 RepID=UPI0012DAF937|nr:hypothetical protein [Mycobacterium asiaticum]
MGAWLRPLPKYEPPPAPTYTSQQVADAKAKVCAAFQRVHNAVRGNFARDQGTDPNQQLLVALAGQQALIAGANFLKTTLLDAPATANALTAEVQKIIRVYESLAIDYLNGRGSPDVDPSLRAGDDATIAIQRICS